jgi:hypothetical protein
VSAKCPSNIRDAAWRGYSRAAEAAQAILPTVVGTEKREAFERLRAQTIFRNRGLFARMAHRRYQKL